MDSILALRNNCHLGSADDAVNLIAVDDLDRLPWTAAHDGYMAFACAGAVGDTPGTRAEIRKVLADYVRESLTKCTTSIDVANLLAFAGAHEPDKTEGCSKCYDNPGKACSCGECACDNCDGDGTILTVAPVRKGFVFGRLVNLNRVARLLSGADGEVRVNADGRDLDALMFRGATWVAVLLPIRSAPEDAGFPRWDSRLTL